MQFVRNDWVTVGPVAAIVPQWHRRRGIDAGFDRFGIRNTELGQNDGDCWSQVPRTRANVVFRDDM